MRYLVILFAIFMSACSVVDDYSTGRYENQYIETDVASKNNDTEVNTDTKTEENNSETKESKEKVEVKNENQEEKTEVKSEKKIDDKKEESIKTEMKADAKKLEEKIEENKKDESKKEENSEINFENKNEDSKDEKVEKVEANNEKKEDISTIDLLNQPKSEPIEKSDINVEGLSNKSLSWWYRPGKPTSTIDKGIFEMINKYGALWQKPTGQNKMYLTFDEGYEYNENTTSILNTLSEKNVKAAFFITGHFLKSRPDLVQRMVNEGHAVCNHTVDHMNPPTALKNNKFVSDVEGLEKLYKDTIGGNLSPFYRPPEGGYSEATLSAAKSLGYRTTFWSFAYKDWEVKNQPGEDAAIEKITSNFHDGSIILLHAVSDTNTKVLGRIIDKAHEMGFTFGDLNELK